MTAQCDHTSVGILVWQHGKLLMIERRRPPFGIAPPAGHVDDHGSFEQAARDELSEEVGLKAGPLALATAGARNNPCRRSDGSWHYWRIYETEATGTLKRSVDETKGARFYSLKEIVELHQRTQEYLEGKLDEKDWEKLPGLEPVWNTIFAELMIIPNIKIAAPALAPDLKWARDHAWRWFEYHAGQRIIIFRFYLIFIALLVAGYSTLTINGQHWSSIIAGVFLAFATFLFHRLDLRNSQLVKIAEYFLKEEEQLVADRLSRPKLRLAIEAENKWRKRPYSFKDIYSLLFGSIYILSVVMVLWSSWKIWKHVPEIPEFGATVSVRELPVVHIQQSSSPVVDSHAANAVPPKLP